MSSAGSYGAGGGGGVGNVKFLTGNTGGPVGPDLVGNINVVGSGDISVAGNAGTNTLTISLSGAIANVYDADTGTAIPALGILNINGLGGIATSASGHTVDIGTDGTIATNYSTDSGIAIPSADTINIVGGTGITTSGSGDTVTIALSGSGLVESITGDTGSAIAGALTITGGTSGASFNTSGTTITESFNYLNMPYTNAGGTQGVIKFAGSPIFGFYGGVGQFNMFLGDTAGNTSLTGTNNIGLGPIVLHAVTSGFANVGVGPLALSSCTTGNSNVAMGLDALQNLTTGFGNVAVGYQPLKNLLTGIDNVAFGIGAGSNYTGSESNNILISNAGVAAESNVIRIGTQGSGTGQQNTAYMAGIYGSSVGGTNALVFADNTGKLGTTGGTFSAVTSITGDTGSTISGALNITGGSSGALFNTSGSNITESFHFLAMSDTTPTTGYIQMGASIVLAAWGGVASNNIFVGKTAGNANLVGTGNTGVGQGALNSLSASSNGNGNVAVGQISLVSCTQGNDNVALGEGSLADLTTGSSNTACGQLALEAVVTGSNNIALGQDAGSAFTGSDSSNIAIGNVGVSGQSNTIRIGTQGTGAGEQDTCNIAGIYGSTVGGTNSAVFIDNAGNLGTVGGSGGGGVTSITGDTGSGLTGNLFLTGGSSGQLFLGSGVTLTSTFHFLAMSDSTSSTGYIQIGTQKVLNCYGGVANNNIFVGQGAGHATVSGTDNDALGALALAGVTSGAFNIAIGSSSLQGLTTSSSNVSVGLNSLGSLTTGGGNNTSVGFVALGNLGTGANNIAIGSTAGDGYTGAESSNVVIAAQGTGGESNVIRIGTQGSGAGQQNACFIAGIAGVTVASSAAVLIDTATGQLGTVVSSRRYKDNIDDMNNQSDFIYDLRPRTFTYKNDETKTKQYGLIAEEVEGVNDHLVAYNKDGEPETVSYHELVPLLLNEIQRLEARLSALEGKFAARVR
jgi:hypothetical protein